MRRALLLLTLLFVPLYAKQVELPQLMASAQPIKPTAESRQISLANHMQNPDLFPKVNLATGEYVEEAIDLVIAGAEPISLRRFYHHMSSLEERWGNWRINPESRLVANFEWKDSKRFASVGGPEGAITCMERHTRGARLPDLVRQYTNPRRSIFSYEMHPNASYTNASSGGLGASSNPKNSFIYYWRDKDKDKFRWRGAITNGTGGVRFFGSAEHKWHCKRKVELYPRRLFNIQCSPAWWIPYDIPINKEVLPNGNRICYGHQRWRFFENWPQPLALNKITVYNRDESKILGQLHIKYHYYEWEQKVAMGAPKGRMMYFKDKIRDTAAFTVIGSDGRTATFQHNRRGGFHAPVVLLSATTPTETTKYNYKPGGILECVDKGKGHLFKTEYDPKTGKIAAQYAPVGPNGKLEAIARFRYHKDSTVVTDGVGNKTTTYFNSKKQTIAVQKADCVERKKWSDRGWLLEECIENKQGLLLVGRRYEYDERGNVLVEERFSAEHSDRKERTYSDCDFNLLLSEKGSSGKETFYNYKAGTNLVLEKRESTPEGLCRRTRYCYDDCAICIKKEVDDGQDFSYKRIIYITPKAEMPCFGLPEEVVEKTVGPEGTEQQLTRVIYGYHPSGKIVSEAHYDANDEHLYTLKNQYDSKERLVSTTDALGNKTTFTYDAHANMLSKKEATRYQEWNYDLANRMIEHRDQLQDGTFLVEKFAYDQASQLISKTDVFGFTTTYSYDALGRISAIHHPDGAVEHREYDPLGNLICETDGAGYQTKRTFDFRSNPLQITYADGSTESFTYRSDGALLWHRDKNGSTTHYTYDGFGRVIASEVGGIQTSATYSAFSKLSETDALGVVTHYDYDFAGRPIKKECQEDVVIYGYDALGRRTFEREGETITLARFDLKNRLTEVRKEILCQKSCYCQGYAYDAADNQTEVITCAGTTYTEYNAQNKPISTTDPEGNVTTMSYSYGGGFRKTTTNSKGVQNVELYDCRGRLATSLVQDDQGLNLQKRERFYDGVGNQTHAIEHIYHEGNFKDTVENRWNYGPCGQLLELVESGTKTTRYLYDQAGRRVKTIKPDGSEVCREYDGFGRLSRYVAEAVDYHYTYNQKHQIVEVKDCINKSATRRTYDAYGNVAQEQLASGVVISRTYDPYGRPTTLTLPDDSKIFYTYRGPYLYSVARNGVEHIYGTRNLAGKVTEMILPAGVGQTAISYNGCLQWQASSSPSFSSNCTYDCLGDLVCESYVDSLGAQTIEYRYDDLGQLISENRDQYGYDSLYNRICKNQQLYTVNSLNQVTDDGQTQYSYDPCGRVISDGTKSYSYDGLDRLIAVDDGVQRTCYQYDAFNRRIAKDDQLFIWDGKREIGVVCAGKVRELRVLGEGLGAELGASVLLELGGETFVPIHNSRGSLVLLLDLDGVAVESDRYTAFGECLTEGKISPWGFSAKRTDEETGYLYFGRRYYAPDLGRWITPDPLGFSDGSNLYAYVCNSPLVCMDLHGLWSLPNFGQMGRSVYNFGKRSLDRAFDFALPVTYAAFHQPRGTASWKLGALGFIAGAEILTAASPARVGANLVGRQAMRITRSGYSAMKNTRLIVGTEKTTSVAISNKIMPKPAITRTNNVQGWRRGQEINNMTRAGRTPSWPTVRARHWKNRAFYNRNAYSDKNLTRMRRGRAQQRYNRVTKQIETRELHHMPPQRDGGLYDFIEVWPDEHAAIDSFRNMKR